MTACIPDTAKMTERAARAVAEAQVARRKHRSERMKDLDVLATMGHLMWPECNEHEWIKRLVAEEVSRYE